MHITKKFDRAFQWAGEKMGGEAKSGQTDEFRMLEAEMNLRQQGLSFIPLRVSIVFRQLTFPSQEPSAFKSRPTPTFDG
jgi:type II secretory pathway component PulF